MKTNLEVELFGNALCEYTHYESWRAKEHLGNIYFIMSENGIDYGAHVVDKQHFEETDINHLWAIVLLIANGPMLSMKEYRDKTAPPLPFDDISGEN